MVSSVPAQHSRPLFTADVSRAFLKGLTVEQAAEHEGDVSRGAPFTGPPSSVNILRSLPVHGNFIPMKEVLRMLRCGFGLKDAPRLWNKLLRKVLSELGMIPLQSDPQLFVWHVD